MKYRCDFSLFEISLFGKELGQNIASLLFRERGRIVISILLIFKRKFMTSVPMHLQGKVPFKPNMIQYFVLYML